MAANDTHMSTRMIYLSSANAYKTIGTGESLFYFDDIIHCPQNIGMTLRLTSLQFCNSQYTVTAGRNDKIDLRFSPEAAYSDTTITIASGFYTHFSFNAAVQTVLNDTFSVDYIVMGFNSRLGKFQFTGDDNFRGIWRDGTTCFGPLGYPRNASKVEAGNGFLMMPNPCNFSGLTSLYFEMLNIPTNALDSRTGMKSSVLARVNVDAETGAFVYYRDDSATRLRLTATSLNVFHCRITDAYNDAVDFNGIGWSCSLLVSFHYNVTPRPYPSLETILAPLLNGEEKKED